jgi:hypothetical protein
LGNAGITIIPEPFSDNWFLAKKAGSVKAYKSAGITWPRNQVKAYEVRAIASSWSIFNSASLTEILSAGFWWSDNTFYYHFLRSIPQHTDNLYSLDPLVSAQKVIFPPTS